MDWIKKNYEKFALLLVALALLAVSVFLILGVRTFLASFEGLKAPVVESNKVPDLEPVLKPLEDAKASIQKPGAWTGHQGSLFVSRRYILKDPDLIDPFDPKTGMQLHPPVPNEWFIKYNLDITDPDILTQDADGDGFTNLDEFNAGTDPLDKNSHPAYTTKLKLAKFIQVKFRLLFSAQPDADSYQINTVDLNQPSQILKIGDQIVGTKFKLIKFEPKSMTDSNGIDHNISELTIQNTETGAQVVLIYDKQADSPDSYAVFKYLWNNTQITVKKDQEFVLKPEVDVKYKLIDINDQEAVIQTATGDKIKIPHFEEEKH
ncbi:MAG: Amuc_1099 family pilus-like system protein [Chthoniobacteraceae bacterium]